MGNLHTPLHEHNATLARGRILQQKHIIGHSKRILARIAFILFFIVIFTGALRAQTPSFSMFFNTPQFVNPALTGQFNGKYRLNLNYRSQWNSALGNAYITQGAGFDMNSGRHGFGLVAVNQMSGDAAFQRFLGYLSYSYDFLYNKPNHLVLGVQAGALRQSFDPSRLTFGSQYIPGIGYNPANSSNESFLYTERFSPDFAAGLMWYNASSSSKWNPFLGVSVYHLALNNQSFGDNRIEMPMRYLAHAGMKIEVNPSFYLQPHLIATYQNEAMDILAGGHLSFRLGDGDSFFQVGALYRYGDSFIPFLGFETGGMILGFSYDANVGELSGNSENFSVFEISLLYVFAKKSYTNKYVCPRL